MITSRYISRLGWLVAAMAAASCQTMSQRADAGFEDACAVYGTPASGETVVVMREQSDDVEVAASAYRAGMGIDPWAATVGPGVITSRGGAIAGRSKQARTTMRPCPAAGYAPTANDQGE